MAYKIQVEAARAAALAALSAAGLVAQAKRNASGPAVGSLADALRLLRSSEATARAAVDALTMPSHSPDKSKGESKTGGAGGGGVGGGATGADAAMRPTRRRRRRKRGVAMETQEAVADGVALSVAASGGGVAAAAVGVVATPGEDLPDDSWADEVGRSGGGGAVAHTVRPVRALAKQTSRERSPRSSGGRLAVGTLVKAVDLANRFELNGCTGVLAVQDVAGGDGDRYNVRLDTSGTCVRVLRANLEVLKKKDTGFSFSRR